MSKKSILDTTHHRQYPIPAGPWQHYQEWHGNIMLHWKIDPFVLKEHIPRGVEPDLFDGEAWVSIIAFSVRRLRPRFLPPLPIISDFHEVNLRTYVVRDGKPGIYFFSIEAEKLVPAMLARLVMGLPYKKAVIKRGDNRYSSNGKDGKALKLKIAYKGTMIRKSRLDTWLTERHCLYEQLGKKLFRIDIHHKPWPLEDVDIVVDRLQKYPFCNGEPHRVHYSPKLQVLLWSRTFLDR